MNVFDFARNFGKVNGVYKIAVYPQKNEVHVWVSGKGNVEMILNIFEADEIKVLRGDNYLLKFRIGGE